TRTARWSGQTFLVRTGSRMGRQQVLHACSRCDVAVRARNGLREAVQVGLPSTLDQARASRVPDHRGERRGRTWTHGEEDGGTRGREGCERPGGARSGAKVAQRDAHRPGGHLARRGRHGLQARVVRIVAIVLTVWVGWRWIGFLLGTVRVREFEKGPVRREARRTVVTRGALNIFLSIVALYLWAEIRRLQPSDVFVGFLAAAMMCSLAI